MPSTGPGANRLNLGYYINETRGLNPRWNHFVGPTWIRLASRRSPEERTGSAGSYFSSHFRDCGETGESLPSPVCDTLHRNGAKGRAPWPAPPRSLAR